MKRLRVFLAFSLALNLFLVGLIAGTGFLRDGRRDRGSRHAAFEQAVKRLDPADAEALKTLMRAKAERAEPRFQALRESRRDVQRLMAAPEFDPAAVRAAVTRVRIEETALRNDFDRDLIDFAARLDPQERAAVAPLLRRGSKGPKRDRRSDGPRGRGRSAVPKPPG